jgi:MarR family transcriptional regulator, transcriptional regulator for hemolysin
MRREDPNQNLGFLLHDVARLLRLSFDRRARPLGLTRSQWWALNYLFLNEGATQTELAVLLDIEKPALGRLIDRLERKGWVARRADGRDRRAKRLYLTRAIAATMRELRRLARETLEEAQAGLAPEDRFAFIGTLQRLRENLTRRGNGERIANG